MREIAKIETCAEKLCTMMLEPDRELILQLSELQISSTADYR